MEKKTHQPTAITPLTHSEGPMQDGERVTGKMKATKKKDASDEGQVKLPTNLLLLAVYHRASSIKNVRSLGECAPVHREVAP